MKNTISILTITAIVLLSINTFTTSDLNLKDTGKLLKSTISENSNAALGALENLAEDTQDTAQRMAKLAMDEVTEDSQVADSDQVALNQIDEMAATESKTTATGEGSNNSINDKQIIPILSVKVHENPNDPNSAENTAQAENTLDKSARASMGKMADTQDQKVNSLAIQFAFASAKLGAQSEKEITSIKSKLMQAKTIQLKGFTDNIGNQQANINMSERRIAAVKNSLLKLGIPANKIESMPMGDQSPIASNANAEGRMKNRRVEILIIQNIK